MLSSLSQRAALQANMLTPDGGGGYTGLWQTFALAWVNITPAGAGDVFGPDARESRVRHRIVLRARDDVVAGVRLAVEARIFAVHAVLADEPERGFSTLLCEELP